jgi:hypothetical protein
LVLFPLGAAATQTESLSHGSACPVTPSEEGACTIIAEQGQQEMETWGGSQERQTLSRQIASAHRNEQTRH